MSARDRLRFGSERHSRAECSSRHALHLVITRDGVPFVWRSGGITKPAARDSIYRRRHFAPEVIEQYPRWCIMRWLSYRDLVAMKARQRCRPVYTNTQRYQVALNGPVPRRRARSLLLS
jgi:hypothetical protein